MECLYCKSKKTYIDKQNICSCQDCKKIFYYYKESKELDFNNYISIALLVSLIIYIMYTIIDNNISFFSENYWFYLIIAGLILILKYAFRSRMLFVPLSKSDKFKIYLENRKLLENKKFIEFFSSLFYKDEEESELYLDLAIYLDYSLENSHEAKKYYHKSLKLDNENAAFNLAELYYEEKEYVNAVAYYLISIAYKKENKKQILNLLKNDLKLDSQIIKEGYESQLRKIDTYRVYTSELDIN